MSNNEGKNETVNEAMGISDEVHKKIMEIAFEQQMKAMVLPDCGTSDAIQGAAKRFKELSSDENVLFYGMWMLGIMETKLKEQMRGLNHMAREEMKKSSSSSSSSWEDNLTRMIQ
jgi:hypothetical protein